MGAVADDVEAVEDETCDGAGDDEDEEEADGAQSSDGRGFSLNRDEVFEVFQIFQVVPFVFGLFPVIDGHLVIFYLGPR
jgi:hypothetical protein